MNDNEKIDIVLTWVDGSDPSWQAEKSKYEISSGVNNLKQNNNEIDTRDIRYRDWDTLKYWFRGVEKYAPWINRIHFVTWGHLPKWLNTSNPKLNIVNHHDFIPEDYLPTFSSHVIELNLFRIPDLTEQFAYFNDDVFLLNPVEKSDFFQNGKPCDSAIQSPAIMENKNGIGNVELNNMAIINTYFDKKKVISSNKSGWFNLKYEPDQLLKNVLLKPWNSFTSFYEFHIETNLLKSTYKKVWDLEGKTLDMVCRHKFRDLKLDNNQWLIRDWQLAENNFVPRTTKFGKLYYLHSKDNIEQIIEKEQTKCVCFNDPSDLSDKEFIDVKNRMKKAFEKKFPEKSSFEK